VHSAKELDRLAYIVFIMSLVQFSTFSFTPFFTISWGSDADTRFFSFVEILRTIGSGRYSYSIQMLLFWLVAILFSFVLFTGFMVYRTLNQELEFDKNKKLELLHLFLRFFVPLLYVPFLSIFVAFIQCDSSGYLYPLLCCALRLISYTTTWRVSPWNLTTPFCFISLTHFRHHFEEVRCWSDGNAAVAVLAVIIGLVMVACGGLASLL
jgi:hypothetical protein